MPQPDGTRGSKITDLPGQLLLLRANDSAIPAGRKRSASVAGETNRCCCIRPFRLSSCDDRIGCDRSHHKTAAQLEYVKNSGSEHQTRTARPISTSWNGLS